MNAKFSHDHGSLSHGHHIQDKLLATNYLAQNVFPPKKCCITFFKKKFQSTQVCQQKCNKEKQIFEEKLLQLVATDQLKETLCFSQNKHETIPINREYDIIICHVDINHASFVTRKQQDKILFINLCQKNRWSAWQKHTTPTMQKH